MNISILKTIALVAVLAMACEAARGQAPVIGSFGINGELVCTNLQPDTLASVEWAPTVSGPWTNTWAGLAAVRADSNKTIRVAVPMFYRVRGVAWTNEPVILTNPPSPAVMALIPAGAFTMGDTFAEEKADELPTHTVYVSAFYMDKYEVSKALWDEVYEFAINYGYDFDHAGSGKATNHPVQTVSWYDAVKWCNARSEKEGRAPAYYTDAEQTLVYRNGQVAIENSWVKWNTGYRLPTEAEWEKAARGGLSGLRFPWGDTITHSQANYYSETHYSFDVSPTRGYHPDYAVGDTPYTSPVGSFAANGYGLYDMAGNVWEWCWDRYWNIWYGYTEPDGAEQDDTRGPASGKDRVMRGGSWWDNFADFGGFTKRCALREYYGPTKPYAIYGGFRCVMGF